MKSVACVLLITTVAFFIGAACFFGYLNGINGILLSPILAFFGWYFWLIILCMTTLAWFLFKPKVGIAAKCAYICICFIVGLFIAVIFSLGPGMDRSLVEALRCSSAISACVIAVLVMTFKEWNSTRTNHSTRGANEIKR